MRPSLGQPVTVQNVGGASGTISGARVARATPGGYNIGFGQRTSPRERLTPETLGAHHKAEIEKWWPMIKAAGIKLQ